MKLLNRAAGGLFILYACVLAADTQTTSFDPNAQVQVEDTRPTIVANAQKVYTTSLNLVKTSSAVTFEPSFFSDQAGQYYSSVLAGFASVSNVQNTDLDSTRIRVTYDVAYTFSTLNSSISADDARIADTIGTFVPVRNGLNNQPGLIAFYFVEDDATTFSFSGSSMCSVATCTGTYVTCTETTSGIDVKCVANCKTGYCKNGATCSQSGPNSPPVCTCVVLPDLWYIGTQCETQIALWLVILLSVIGFIIIVVVIIVVCCCVIKKRRRRRYKEKLANMPLPSHSNGQQNNGFVNDEARATTVPQTNLVPRSLPAMSLERDDSFDTVTSNGTSRHDRRSYATSRTNSTHGHHHHHRRHHHHYDDHRHHHRHHRDHHRHRSRSRESDHHQRRSRRTSSSSEATSAPETVEDQKNLSFYEIDVKSLMSSSDSSNGTEPTASVAAESTTNRSPIRWLPPKGIETRPGWVPSLGPMMYELRRSNDDLATEPEDNGNTGYETITFNRPKGETDL